MKHSFHTSSNFPWIFQSFLKLSTILLTFLMVWSVETFLPKKCWYKNAKQIQLLSARWSLALFSFPNSVVNTLEEIELLIWLSWPSPTFPYHPLPSPTFPYLNSYILLKALHEKKTKKVKCRSASLRKLAST